MKQLSVRKLAAATVAALVLAAVPMFKAAVPALAAGCVNNTAASCTQTTSATVAGALSVSAAQAGLNAGTMQPNTGNSPGLGNINYTNTLGDGLKWSVSLAATDMATSGYSSTTCTTSAGCIPFLKQGLFGSSPTIVGTSGAATTGMTTGCNSSATLFSGTDTTPGTTFSSSLALMSGATSANQGSYTQSGCFFTVFTAADQSAGTYNGLLQYTITG